MLDGKRLMEILKEPESDTLEFKIRLPPIDLVRKNIMAFANTKGGKLILGVGENQEILGIDDPETTKKKIFHVAKEISPPVEIRIEEARVDEKIILIIDIPKGEKIPYIYDGASYQRLGPSVIPIDSNFLTLSLKNKDSLELQNSIRQLSHALEQNTRTIDNIRNWRFGKAKTWIIIEPLIDRNILIEQLEYAKKEFSTNYETDLKQIFAKEAHTIKGIIDFQLEQLVPESPESQDKTEELWHYLSE